MDVSVSQQLIRIGLLRSRFPAVGLRRSIALLDLWGLALRRKTIAELLPETYLSFTSGE